VILGKADDGISHDLLVNCMPLGMEYLFQHHRLLFFTWLIDCLALVDAEEYQ
jgi:hypothetical protein